MSEVRQRAQPIDGLTIRRSIIKTLGWMILAVVWFPMGCALIWGKIQGMLFGVPPGGYEITLYGFVLGLVMVVSTPIMVYQLSRSLLVRRRLVIGDDRLQIQERQGKDHVAVLQIPFANIAQVQYEVTTTDRQVAIDLKEPEDPDTYGEDNDFRASAKLRGHHYCLAESFCADADAIAGEIQRAMKLWAASLDAEPCATADGGRDTGILRFNDSVKKNDA